MLTNIDFRQTQFLGKVETDLNWEYRNLSGAFFGCAVSYQGKMRYFGGVGAESTQVIKSDLDFVLIKHSEQHSRKLWVATSIRL